MSKKDKYDGVGAGKLIYWWVWAAVMAFLSYNGEDQRFSLAWWITHAITWAWVIGLLAATIRWIDLREKVKARERQDQSPKVPQA